MLPAPRRLPPLPTAPPQSPAASPLPGLVREAILRTKARGAPQSPAAGQPPSSAPPPPRPPRRAPRRGLMQAAAGLRGGLGCVRQVQEGGSARCRFPPRRPAGLSAAGGAAALPARSRRPQCRCSGAAGSHFSRSAAAARGPRPHRPPPRARPLRTPPPPRGSAPLPSCPPSPQHAAPRGVRPLRAPPRRGYSVCMCVCVWGGGRGDSALRCCWGEFCWGVWEAAHGDVAASHAGFGAGQWPEPVARRPPGPAAGPAPHSPPASHGHGQTCGPALRMNPHVHLRSKPH